MRFRLATLVLAALAFPLAAGATAPLRVVFKTGTHTPKVNAVWPWSVTATSAGKPVAGTVTAVVIDPVGGVHAVEFGCCKTKFITNVRFKGTFRDYVRYPLISKGYRVTFKVTVKTALGTKSVSTWVKAL